MARGGIILVENSLGPGIAGLTPQLRRAIRAIMGRYAPRVEAFMKNSAPWTDRTGLARAGLGAQAIADRSDVYAIVLYHTVSYGFWLEVRWSGQYAVIVPTIETYGPQVMQGFERLIERME